MCGLSTPSTAQNTHGGNCTYGNGYFYERYRFLHLPARHPSCVSVQQTDFQLQQFQQLTYLKKRKKNKQSFPGNLQSHTHNEIYVTEIVQKLVVLFQQTFTRE